MAVSELGSGAKGRRRSLDAEINLVPFIDLLSMCICFLLMAAIWTELSSVQVKQSTGTAAPQTALKSVDLDVKFINANEISISVKKTGKPNKVFAVKGISEQELYSNLDLQVTKFKQEIEHDAFQVGAVMLTPSQNVSYGSLVHLMDIFRKNQMNNIGVVPVVTKVGG